MSIYEDYLQSMYGAQMQSGRARQETYERQMMAQLGLVGPGMRPVPKDEPNLLLLLEDEQ